MATDFAAGWVGGCVGVVVGHPLDTIKVHMQLRGARYAGTLDCVKSLMAKEGARGLYKGITSPLAGVAAINAIVFGVYGNVQRKFQDPDALKTQALAGAIAGFVQSGICGPMELAKIRAQTCSGESSSPLKVLMKIHKFEGLKGVFRGMGVTIAREVPAFASYFMTYEMLTRNKDGSGGRTSTARMLFAGGMAGCVSWTIVYPVDVIKTRMQADGMSGNPRYVNSWDCLRKSVAGEGYGFLGRGLTPTVLRAFPTNAATFAAVTWSMRLLTGEVGVDFAASKHLFYNGLFWRNFELAIFRLAYCDSIIEFM